MTGEPARADPEWDGEPTVPQVRDTTVRSARGKAGRASTEAAAGRASTDDETIVVRRAPGPEASRDDDRTSEFNRTASIPNQDELRTPYEPRTAPVVAPRPELPVSHASRTRSASIRIDGDSRGDVRAGIDGRIIALTAVAASVLVAAGTLLFLVISGVI